LRVWTYFGLLVASAALADMLFIIITRTLIYGIDVPGYASLVVMLLFFSGMNMIGLGMLGEYLGRVFIEVKRRPLYLSAKRSASRSRTNASRCPSRPGSPRSPAPATDACATTASRR
jgi:hypothetical protein